MACKRVIKTNMGIHSLSASQLWRPHSHTTVFPPSKCMMSPATSRHAANLAPNGIFPLTSSKHVIMGSDWKGVYGGGGLWPHNVFSWPKNWYAVCNLSPWVNCRNVGLLRTPSGFSQRGEWNVPFLGRKMPLFALFETIKFFPTMALTTVAFPQGGTGQRDNSWTHASEEH